MPLLAAAINIALGLIFLRIILSWFPPTGGVFDSVQRFVFTATEWAMGPLRRAIPPARFGGVALDLSPIILILGLSLLRGIVAT